MDAGKPLGAICIAPVVVALALTDSGVKPTLTIGNDTGTAADIEFFGARHKNAKVDEIAVDAEHKIVTTPAYMLGKGPAEVFEGIRGLVGEVLRLAGG